MKSRQNLLESAFSSFPSVCGNLTLRPLSAGSFTLLCRLRNAMVFQGAVADVKPEDLQAKMFDAVVEYVWLHSAELDQVLAVETADDIPSKDLRKLSFELAMDDAIDFIATYQAMALRMSAGLTEVVPDDEETAPGKLPESLPAGSPPSSMPVEHVEMSAGSDTSSGSCPSSEPLPTSMPPTSPTAPRAGGRASSLDSMTMETRERQS